MPRASARPVEPATAPVPDARVLAIEPLTGRAAEIAEAIGPDAALRLMAHVGGTEVNIPVRAEGSALAAVVGLEVAELAARAFGPGKMTVPTGSLRGARGRRARGLCLLMDGASIGAVATACDVHMQTVKGWRRLLDDRDLLPSSPTPERDPR